MRFNTEKNTTYGAFVLSKLLKQHIMQLKSAQLNAAWMLIK